MRCVLELMYSVFGLVCGWAMHGERLLDGGTRDRALHSLSPDLRDAYTLGVHSESRSTRESALSTWYRMQ